jgi:hypothetical protein
VKNQGLSGADCALQRLNAVIKHICDLNSRDVDFQLHRILQQGGWPGVFAALGRCMQQNS